MNIIYLLFIDYNLFVILFMSNEVGVNILFKIFKLN